MDDGGGGDELRIAPGGVTGRESSIAGSRQALARDMTSRPCLLSSLGLWQTTPSPTTPHSSLANPLPRLSCLSLSSSSACSWPVSSATSETVRGGRQRRGGRRSSYGGSLVARTPTTPPASPHSPPPSSRAVAPKLRANFGFMFSFTGRTLFILFCATVLFALNNLLSQIVGAVTVCEWAGGCGDERGGRSVSSKREPTRARSHLAPLPPSQRRL